MFILIDNYDSFTWNLWHFLSDLGAKIEIVRNDAVSADNIIARNPEGIIVSPGPGIPQNAGITMALILAAKEAGTPLLGVCLGHQCIGQAFGGKVVRASRLMHGKTSPIKHNQKDLFKDLPNPFVATRYHSLIVESSSLPDCLSITAQTDENEIMGLRHSELPVWGVQFHPESLATEKGIMILKNFLEYC